MKKYIFIFLVFCSILFSSCGDFQEVTFSGIENVNIISLTQQGAEAEITAKIKNPNNVAFTIYPADMDVVLGGINAGKAHLTGKTKIKANSDESYTFRIKSDLDDTPVQRKFLKENNIGVVIIFMQRQISILKKEGGEIFI